MSFLTGSVKSQASQNSAVSGLQFQSSAYGKAVPIVYGTTRIAPNLIWYGDFVTQTQSSATSSAGKGGITNVAGGGKGGNSGQYTYQTALALGLCEGQIQGIGNVYVSKSVTTLAALGMSEFNGSYAQAPWGYLQSKHPDQAIGYSGIAYLAASSYQLGNNAELPNHNMEVRGIYSNSLGNGDADPSLVVADLLSNPHYGAGFPAERIGDLSVYRAYCIATGLWISPAYTSQSQAASIFDTIAQCTNSEFVWSSGVLTLVPYGDQDISANGYSYTAPSAPLYDLTPDDFLAADKNTDSVVITRSQASDVINSLTLECLDRNNNYNPTVVEVKDQALINQFGLNQASSQQAHLFADVNAANISAQLQLQLQSIRNSYQFSLDQRYVLLDPMDIVTLTEPSLGLVKQWVRITEISENNDGTLTITADEYLNGTGNAALNYFQTGQGFSVNYNVPAVSSTIPVIFEPTAELSENLEVWIAASGVGEWGGCEVYLSNDGNSYKQIGVISSPARTGVLTQLLPSVSLNSTGQLLDNINTVSVDLSTSGGQLLSASQSDALALATLCYVDGEYIAYQNATLVAPNHYVLSGLVRACYDTLPVNHYIGSNFVRIDNAIFKYGFTPDNIGKTIFIKLLSFNRYGGGLQGIADVPAYNYTIKGTAFASPLPNVTNLRTSYIASLTQLTWDEITDFRSVLYEIRQGTSWNGGQVMNRVAHPPFTVSGNGTYWVSGYAQPVAGLEVYSEFPEAIVITGSQVTQNVIAVYDEAATGWSGTVSGTAAIIAGELVTGNTGNILAITDYLGTANFLYFGNAGNGIYEIPTAHHIDIGRPALCNILINYLSFGQNTDDDILASVDYLAVTDIVDYASSANVTVYPEIALSQDGTTWAAWQRYSAGAYLARTFKARMQLQRSVNDVQAIVSSFTFSVDVPDRDDHYVNLAVPGGGLTLAFTPDGASSAAPFNGGTQGSSIPSIQATILGAVAGDMVVITSVTLSGCHIAVVNGGAGVARNVNLLVQGY